MPFQDILEELGIVRQKPSTMAPTIPPHHAYLQFSDAMRYPERARRDERRRQAVDEVAPHLAAARVRLAEKLAADVLEAEQSVEECKAAFLEAWDTVCTIAEARYGDGAVSSALYDLGLHRNR